MLTIAGGILIAVVVLMVLGGLLGMADGTVRHRPSKLEEVMLAQELRYDRMRERG